MLHTCMPAPAHLLCLQPLFSLVSGQLFYLFFFLKSIVKALSVIPVGVFGYCHKHKRIILALWFCRNPSCGYSTELRGRTAKHNSHLSCLLSCIYMPPMPYQVAGLLLFPPPSVCLTQQALRALAVCLCSAQSISTLGFSQCIKLTVALVAHRNNSFPLPPAIPERTR